MYQLLTAHSQAGGGTIQRDRKHFLVHILGVIADVCLGVPIIVSFCILFVGLLLGIW